MAARLRSLLAAALTLAPVAAPVAGQGFALERGDRICLLGGAFAERMLHHGWLETRLQARFADLELSVRNLGCAGDELTVRQRTDGFGSPDDHLTRCRATVVFAFFGFNESFAGDAGLPAFRQDLAAFVDHVRAQRYDGENPPRLVLFTPLALEDASDRGRSDGVVHNARLAAYGAAMREIARARAVPCVDLFAASRALYARAPLPLTIDGMLLAERGDRAIATAIEGALFGNGVPAHDPELLDRIRQAVLDKDRCWFDRYHVTDGYNVYGGRSTLSYKNGVTNADVLQRELEVLDAMTANRDAHIRALALGRPHTLDDANVPPLIPVATNAPGPLSDGAYEFLDGDDAVSRMHVHDGMRVALFASEREFPDLVNPVQIAFDASGRLWVATWPSYTHALPGQPKHDALLVFHDDDGDGRADRRTVFAGDLHNPTGFELWNGGVLVAQAPDLMFLRDRDGDGVADERERILHGLSTSDTHHTANSFVLGPDGALYFQEGTFHRTQIETPFGPVRNQNACVWRFEPRTGRVERHVPVDFANPHGHVFDRWGQDFVYDGTGADPYHALLNSGHLDGPANKHPHGPMLYEKRTRPCAAVEILSSSHFPLELQGNLLVANVIGLRGVQQYRLVRDGASFRGEEIAPIVTSDDPNFRPSDLEIGPDGALWIADWHNPLIGHMQHHIRDPNRDRTHGRVYRVTCEGRAALAPARLTGAPLADVVAVLGSNVDRERYRARIELSARDGHEAVHAARAWLATRATDSASYEHDRLEVLWLAQQHGIVDAELLRAVLGSPDARARAAATRVLRQGRALDDALVLLRAQVADDDALVRCEAVVAASFFTTASAAEIALDALRRPMDRALEHALGETIRQLAPHWRAALAAPDASFGIENPRAIDWLVARIDAAELPAFARNAYVRDAVIERAGVARDARLTALRGRAMDRGTTAVAELLDALLRADGGDGAGQQDLARLLPSLPSHELAKDVAAIDAALGRARGAVARQALFASLVAADGNADRAFARASTSLADLRAFVAGLSWLDDRALLATARPAVAGLLERMPAGIAAAPARGVRYVRIALPRRGTLTLAEVEVLADGANVARGKSASQSTTAHGGAAARAIDGSHDGAYGVGTSTHTQEDRDAPWWEVDLGAEVPVAEIVVWNRTDDALGARLDGFEVSVLDGARAVQWSRAAVPAPSPSVRLAVALDPVASLRDAARALLRTIDGAPAEAATERPARDPAVMALGAAVYRRDAHCATCHQAHGDGLPGQYPPIAGTPWVLGDEERLIKLVLHGMWGDVEVNGVTFRSPPSPPMIAFAPLLTDAEVAAVLTYVRASFGNDAPPVGEDTVRRVRAATVKRDTFWTPAELLEQHPIK